MRIPHPRLKFGKSSDMVLNVFTLKDYSIRLSLSSRNLKNSSLPALARRIISQGARYSKTSHDLRTFWIPTFGIEASYWLLGTFLCRGLPTRAGARLHRTVVILTPVEPKPHARGREVRRETARETCQKTAGFPTRAGAEALPRGREHQVLIRINLIRMIVPPRARARGPLVGAVSPAPSAAMRARSSPSPPNRWATAAAVGALRLVARW